MTCPNFILKIKKDSEDTNLKITPKRENMYAWDVKMIMTQEHNMITINTLNAHLNCKKSQTIDKICKNLHSLINMTWCS